MIIKFLLKFDIEEKGVENAKKVMKNQSNEV